MFRPVYIGSVHISLYHLYAPSLAVFNKLGEKP